MDTLIKMLTELSSMVGVPVTLALAYAAFIIRDQGKRIANLEKENVDLKKWSEEKLEDAKNRFDNSRKEIVTKFEGKLDALMRDQKQEFSNIYGRVDDMAKTVSKIDGYLFQKHGGA